MLANDSDPDGDSLSIATFTQAAHGTVAQVSGGLRYTPTTGYSGADTFNYTVSDGRGGTSTAKVSLTVQSAAATSVQVDSGRMIISGAAGRNVVTITGVGNGMGGQYVIVTGQGTQTVSGVIGRHSDQLAGWRR